MFIFSPVRLFIIPSRRLWLSGLRRYIQKTLVQTQGARPGFGTYLVMRLPVTFRSNKYQKWNEQRRVSEAVPWTGPKLAVGPPSIS